MGVALIDQGELIYHGVSVIPKQRFAHLTLRKGKKVITRLIDDFRPDVFAIEKTFFARSKTTAILNIFADEIKKVAHRNEIPVIEYAPSSIKKFLCGDGHAEKLEVAKTVAAWHPELKVYLTQDRDWKVRFHQNMFDAVALGMMVDFKDVGIDPA